MEQALQQQLFAVVKKLEKDCEKEFLEIGFTSKLEMKRLLIELIKEQLQNENIDNSTGKIR